MMKITTQILDSIEFPAPVTALMEWVCMTLIGVVAL